MATVTTRESTAGQAASAATGSPVTVASERPGEYRCECGHVLRVSGGGRHRVYFELADSSRDNPVMDRACPRCGLGLPGKNRP